jgi:hypothetical protein
MEKRKFSLCSVFWSQGVSGTEQKNNISPSMGLKATKGLIALTPEIVCDQKVSTSNTIFCTVITCKRISVIDMYEVHR